MIDIYRKRFTELYEQMETLLASKASIYNSYLKKNEIEIDSNALLEWTVKVRNFLIKACGEESEHYKEFTQNKETGFYGTYLETLKRLRAVFLVAKEDFEGGYFRTTRSLIQAEVFDSELEQAQSLIDVGYKSPGAVVVGIVLETALRELCDRHSIPHAKLDKMNSDLAKVGVYNKLQQKRITALADIRNSAAHGKPDEFTEIDVTDIISDVKSFLEKYL